MVPILETFDISLTFRGDKPMLIAYVWRFYSVRRRTINDISDIEVMDDCVPFAAFDTEAKKIVWGSFKQQINKRETILATLRQHPEPDWVTVNGGRQLPIDQYKEWRDNERLYKEQLQQLERIWLEDSIVE